MGLREWAIKRLDGIPRRAYEAATARAYEAGYDDGEDEPVTGTIRRYGYESLRTGGTREGKISWEQRLDTSYALLESNPVVKRFSEVKRDYIIGPGAQIQCQDDALKDICDVFWAMNEMDVHASEFAHQLYGLGAQLFTVGIREADGMARMGYVDPGQIEKVETNPDNAMQRIAVVVKSQDRGDWYDAREKRVYRIVQTAEDGEYEGKRVTAKEATLYDWEADLLKHYGKSEYDGDCLYYRVNAMSNETLGHSDFICSADVLDQMDDTLFALGEREQMAGFFSFDVTLTAANGDDVLRRARELRLNPPHRGSVNVHNDSEAWRMDAPDLRQGGSVETVKEQLAFVAGACGYPVAWFGRGDETNRATAQAQADPTWRSLEHDQGVAKAMLLDMLLLARDQAIIAGYYRPAEDADITIDLIMPEMTTKDLAGTTSSLAQLTSALVLAKDQGWITDEQAIEIWAKVAGELGVEIDVSEAPALLEPEEEPLEEPDDMIAGLLDPTGDEPDELEEPDELATMPQRERVMAVMTE